MPDWQLSPRGSSTATSLLTPTIWVRWVDENGHAARRSATKAITVLQQDQPDGSEATDAATSLTKRSRRSTPRSGGLQVRQHSPSRSRGSPPILASLHRSRSPSRGQLLRDFDCRSRGPTLRSNASSEAPDPNSRTSRLPSRARGSGARDARPRARRHAEQGQDEFRQLSNSSVRRAATDT